MSSVLVGDADPKLKEALAEIEAVLDRYKIAGAIQLASSTHGEFKIKLPDWSAVQLNERPEQNDLEIRIKSSSEQDGHQHLESSVHLLLSLRDMSGAHAGYLRNLGEHVIETLKGEGVDIDHVVLPEDDDGLPT